MKQHVETDVVEKSTVVEGGFANKHVLYLSTQSQARNCFIEDATHVVRSVVH